MRFIGAVAGEHVREITLAKEAPGLREQEIPARIAVRESDLY